MGYATSENRETLLAQLGEQIHAIGAAQSPAGAHSQIGQLLLTLSFLARSMDVDAEHALSDATNRLIDSVAEET